ncbi:hypothetical protein [Tardiphaga robiniae]|uniref:Uncharacterized protein n=1 Tax=Tardiphaga robiniae TaxID=943830 RepID=A0A7G6TVI5_9BRAD|nr:hypothetical protein [Tardiphaga robiniae]QND70767.1 hypothetical protein HB776_05605 [Tardiphaga robiniae]
MSMLERFFGGKATVITSTLIRADIERCESEIAALHGTMDGAMAGLATMTDADHVAAEATIAAGKRSVARLDARVAHLTAELPKVIAAEEAAAKIAADEALRQRAEAARKANAKEAAKLLSEYEKLAGPMADILARLAAIDAEREAVNEALHKNPVAEGVVGYSTLLRKAPDRSASERRETRPCWVYKYPASPRDTERLKFVQFPASEEVRVATVGPDGTPYPVGPVLFDTGARKIPVHPKLENREVVVGRTMARLGLHEEPLSAISLPPAFAGGKRHWPRT